MKRRTVLGGAALSLTIGGCLAALDPPGRSPEYETLNYPMYGDTDRDRPLVSRISDRDTVDVGSPTPADLEEFLGETDFERDVVMVIIDEPAGAGWEYEVVDVRTNNGMLEVETHLHDGPMYNLEPRGVLVRFADRALSVEDILLTHAHVTNGEVAESWGLVESELDWEPMFGSGD